MNKTKIFDRTATAIMAACILILTADVIYSHIYFLRNSEKFPYELHIVGAVGIFFFLFLISANRLRMIFTGQPAEKTDPGDRNFREDFPRSFIGISLLHMINSKSRHLSRSGLAGNVDIDAVTMEIITLWIFGAAAFVLFYVLWDYFKKKINANKQQSSQ